MTKNDEYILPEDVKRDFVKLPGGGFYKLSVLEKYFMAGYLDFGNEHGCTGIKAIDRLSAGRLLGNDFERGEVGKVRTSDVSKIRVDGGGGDSEPERVCFHQDRYFKACAAVPAEFWAVVRRVCVENKPLNAEGSRLDVKRDLYRQRIDLCRGLDRLIEFYKRKK